MPKQLLRLGGDRTLIQTAFDRTQPLIDAEQTWVVTNVAQAELTRTQLPEVPGRQVLVEPCGRNTAPCIGLAAIHLLARDPDASMVVMPADHVITPAMEFQNGVRQAVTLVDEDPQRLVLFGIKPEYPAVGYGYIERGDSLPGDSPAFNVASFREKPDRETAEHYLATGQFYWNCGIFVWRAQSIVEALKRFEPEIHQRLVKLAGHIGTQGWQTALEKEFTEMKSISIDFAVLERAERICVLEAPFSWDDVGAWRAIERLSNPDESGNTVDGVHVGLDTSGCIIRATDDHLVATIGLEDMIVVHTPDATLVAPKNDENAVRRLVDQIRAAGLDRYL